MQHKAMRFQHACHVLCMQALALSLPATSYCCLCLLKRVEQAAPQHQVQLVPDLHIQHAA